MNFIKCIRTEFSAFIIRCGLILCCMAAGTSIGVDGGRQRVSA